MRKSNWIISAGIGVKIQDVSNHHCLKLFAQVQTRIIMTGDQVFRKKEAQDLRKKTCLLVGEGLPGRS